MTTDLLTAEVTTIPDCNICHLVGRSRPAEYDASVVYMGRRAWGYVCQEHFNSGNGSLGLGRGQRLVLVCVHYDEVARVGTKLAWQCKKCQRVEMVTPTVSLLFNDNR